MPVPEIVHPAQDPAAPAGDMAREKTGESVAVDAGLGPALRPKVRRGAGHWLRGYLSMLRFELLSQRAFLVFFIMVQILMGAGMVFMYGFFLGDLPPQAAAFVTTGIPALALIPIGFVAVPIVVGNLRIAGSYDFVWSLPVPRSAAAAASCTFYTLLALPGMVVSLAVAVWRYDVTLTVRPLVVPAVLLASIMAASVGFGMAHAIANVYVTNMIGNVLVFFVLLFSPIIVPISQFPRWLAEVHEWLPFSHMAVVIRDALSTGLVTGTARSYLVLGAWTVGAWLVAGAAIARRR